MKKLVLIIFISVFMLSCYALDNNEILKPLEDYNLYVSIYGGNDLESYSSVVLTVENFRGKTISEENAQYGDGYGYTFATKVKAGDKITLEAYASGKHNFISIGGAYGNFNDKILKAVVSTNSTITCSFQVKEEELETPTINGSVYEVRNQLQLRWIAGKVNRGESFENKTVKLMNDIDMENMLFMGMNSFDGIFDGNFYEIKNLYMEYSYTDPPSPFGTRYAYDLAFIRELTKTGVVKNLAVSGKLESDCADISSLVLDNWGIVSNVYNTADIYSSGNRGAGITRYNYATIAMAYNTGNIAGTGISIANFGTVKQVYSIGNSTKRGVVRINSGNIENIFLLQEGNINKDIEVVDPYRSDTVTAVNCLPLTKNEFATLPSGFDASVWEIKSGLSITAYNHNDVPTRPVLKGVGREGK